MATAKYNCVAWTLGDVFDWWECGGEPRRRLEPEHMYWPRGLPDDVRRSTLLRLYARRGYLPCADGSLVPGLEKIALYLTPDGDVDHVALQLPDGWWSSKLGISIDVEHATLDALFDVYGSDLRFVARPVDARPRRPMRAPRRP